MSKSTVAVLYTSAEREVSVHGERERSQRRRGEKESSSRKGLLLDVELIRLSNVLALPTIFPALLELYEAESEPRRLGKGREEPQRLTQTFLQSRYCKVYATG